MATDGYIYTYVRIRGKVLGAVNCGTASGGDHLQVSKLTELGSRTR